MSQHKYLIKLQDDTYSVKVKDGKRLIFAWENWHDPLYFIDQLIKRGEFGKIADLATLGKKLNDQRN